MTTARLPQRVLTINEFVETYRLCRTTTYKLINSGALHTVLIGKRRLIPVEAAEALLKSPRENEVLSAA